MKIFELSISKYQIFLFLVIILFVITGLLLRFVIGPLFLALVFAFILSPLINKLETYGLRRATTAWFTILFGCSVLLFAAFMFVPVLLVQTKALFQQIPVFQDYINVKLIPYLVTSFEENFGIKVHGHKTIVFWDLAKNGVVPSADMLFISLGKSTHIVISVLLVLFFTPAFLFYFIRYKQFFLYKLRSLVPGDMRKRLLPLLAEFDKTLRGVLRGQLLVITFLSCLYASAFALAGMPYGLAVGFITGLVRIIPYMDILVGGVLSFFVLATDPQPFQTVLSVVIAFASIQVFDAFFLTPKVLGKVSGLHPFIIILSVLCFGDWFGFFGVILAIPSAAVGRVLIKTLINAYKKSRFFCDAETEYNYKRR